MLIKFILCVSFMALIGGSALAASFKGCYRENKRERYFGLSPGGYDVTWLNVGTCQGLCRAYKYQYAGLMGNKDSTMGFCFCGNELPPVETLESDTFCNNPCLDGSADYCGGFDHVAVHKSGIPVQGITLSSNAPTGVTQVFSPIIFDYSVVEGPKSILYQMEFGDGAERSVGNATNMNTKTFSLPGEYIVTVHVSDADIPSLSKKYSVKVLSQSPVTDITLQCPDYVITYEEFQCNASVVGGSYMQVSMDWKDDVTDDFPISDSMLHAAGPAVPNAETATLGNLGSGVSNIILMPSSEFQHEGTLLGFEFYTDNSAGNTGNIEIYVLTPDCSGVGQPYCHATRSCSPTCVVYGQASCTGTFCVSKGGCVEDSCTATSRALSTDPTFTVVQVFTVTPSVNNGYNKHLLSDGQQIQVTPGDILGYKYLGDTTVATRPLDGLEELSDYDSSIASGVMGTTGFLNTGADINGRHFLRAIAARPSWVLFYHEYFTAGEYELKVNVTTDIIESSAAGSFTLTVLEGIDFVIIEAPEFGVTGEVVTFTILPHTGTNVSYVWSWGDITDNNTEEMSCVHMYTQPGVYNVTVVASNPLTSKQNTTVITIEDRMINVLVATNVAEVNTPHQMNFSADSGSEYICVWMVESDPPETFNTDDISTPIAGGDVTHTFSSDGDYTVTVNCSNDVSYDMESFTQTVQYPIVGLAAVPEGALIGTDFKIEWIIDAGTSVTYQVTFDGGVLSHVGDYTLTGSSATVSGFSSVGIFPLIILAKNQVSTKVLEVNFTIEEEITGADVSVDNTDISKGDSVTFTVSANSGTSIKILFNYTDGTNDTFSKPVLAQWLPGETVIMPHTFTIGGVFSATITVWNNFNTFHFTKEITVYNSVDSVTLHSSGNVEFLDRPTDMSIWFDGPEQPTLAKAEVDWGDGSGLETLSNIILHPTVYSHTYTAEGSFPVTARVSNAVSSIDLTTTVQLVVPVVNLALTTTPTHSSVSKQVQVNIYMNKGPGVTLYLNWGEGPLISWPREGITAWDIDSRTHTYNVVGTYNITVTASNILGNTTKTYAIVVQNPVLENFTVSTSPPVIYNPVGPNTMSLTLTYPHTLTLPDSATVTVDYGDGGDLTTMALPFTTGVTPYTTTLSHDFSQSGAFTITFTIKNLATTVVVEVQVGVYEEISGLTGSPYYRQFEPYDNSLHPGLGDDQSSFPLDQHVVFDMSLAQGTPVKWLVSMVESTAEAIQICDFTTEPLAVQFSQAGDWTVNVTVWNDLGEESKEFSVNIFQAPDGLVLTDEGTSNSNDPKNLSLSFDEIGEDCCVVVDWGDGTQSLYANDANCETTHGLPKDGPINETMTVSHEYPTKGQYEVTVIGTTNSGYVSVRGSIQFLVSDIDCNVPSLRIKDHSPKGSVPREEKKSSAFHVKAYTDLSCSVTLQNHKLWTVDMVNSDLDVIESRDITSLYSSTNTELAIPPMFLDYGLYRFTYRVAMNRSLFPNNEEFASEIETYIKIVASDLRAGLQHSGISFIVRGNNEDVHLDAWTNSDDPDMGSDEDKGFTSFNWRCRDTEEEVEDWTNTFSPLTSEEIPGSPDDGGCFRQGPGTIDTTDGSLTFTTQNMKVNHTYEFTTKVIKGNRSATTTLLLKIVEGAPPAVEIECSNLGFCQPVSDGLLVNLGTRVRLKAVCAQCDLHSLSLQWMMERQGLENSWINVTDLDNYVQGLQSEELAIAAEFFEGGFDLFENMTTYRVTIFASDGTSTGVVYTTIRINRGPNQGRCSVSPTRGTVYTEDFNITCTEWYDPDGINSYQFYATYKDVLVERHLSFTDSPQLISQLSEGPYCDEYNMTLWVRVADRLGSTTTMQIGLVQVVPKNETEIRSEVEELLKEVDNGLVETTAAEGNLWNANNVYQRVGSALNLERNYDKSSFGQLGVASETTATAYAIYSENPVTSQTVYQTDDLTDEEIKELEELYQEERNVRAQLREKMVDSLQDLTIEGVGDILFTTSTLSVLTQSPEELTRQTQRSVVSMVGEMTDRLKALAKDTSIEELRQAAAMMTEVLGYTLEGANMDLVDALKEDLHDGQRSTFYYYDTDWDSSRKGFDGQSLENAEESLSKETNFIVQKDEMKTMVPDALGAVRDVSRLLAEEMVAGENPTIVTSPRLALMVAKDTADTILNTRYTEGGGSFFIPAWCEMLPDKEDCSNQEQVTLVSIATPSNIFGHLGDSVLGFSGTMTIELYDADAQIVGVDNSQVPIEISIPRDTQLQVAVAEEVDEQSSDASASLFYHKFDVAAQGSSLHLEITPEDSTVQFLVLVRLGEFPKLNGSEREWDFLALVPSNMSARASLGINDSSIDLCTVFMDNTRVNDFTGTVYVALRELPEDEHDLYSEDNPPPESEPTDWNFSTSYTTRIWTSGCYFERDGYWQSEGCTVQSTTNHYQTACKCNHLTSFASGFIVQPNTIDFDFVFSNLDFFSNPTLYITEMLVAAMYIIFAIWARREDKKDLEKLGVTPLRDNNPKDKYLYEIQVCTGSRKNAATDSMVNMIFSGEYDETDVRTFEDPKRKIFRRSMTNNFLMAVPGPLGPIQYTRIWHDNSGKGKFQGWYCRYMVIHDLQTKEKFFFIINKWFAVEEDDGQIDRLFPVAGPENLVEFDVLFSQKTRKNLSDEHLWFSVIARPPQSRFTRLQRVSCCLCLLFTSMLASAMFYQRASSAAGQNTLVIGPFALTPEQVYVGIIANLIVFPVNLLIVTLFRKSRPRKKRKSRIEEALKMYQNDVRVNSASSDKRQLVEEQHLDPQFSSIDSRSSTPKLSPAQPLQPAHQPSNMTTLNMDRFTKSHKKASQEAVVTPKKKPLTFPWWCQIVAWVLLWLVTLTSVAFVTFYGISFEDVKCKKWISSMVISFLTSIFLTQPIKVFLVALTLAVLFKKADMEDDGIEDEEEVVLQKDETWLHRYPGPDEFIPTHSRKLAYKPPDPTVLEKAREQRLKELKMYDILREILFYSFFLWVLLVVSYGFRDPNAFFMKQSLDNVFVDNGLGKVHIVSTPDNDFRKVVTRKNFFNWLKEVHAPSLRASNWYNGDQPFYQRGMATDRISRIMGFATLRQLRVNRNLCTTLKGLDEVVPNCNKGYSILDEDIGVYGVKWDPLQANSTWNNSKPEFTYRTGAEIDTYPYWGKHGFYSGGGYLVEMSGSLLKVRDKVDELMEDGWVDKYTRAVFVEFTVYNAQVNLFGIVTLVAEFLISGGVETSHRIEPMNLLGYSSGAYAFQIACEIMYLLFILFFIIKEIRNLYRQKRSYFKQFWNWVEMCIIVLSIICVVVYFYRWYHAKQLTEIFKETHGNAYMKFQYAAYWNEVLTYLMGTLCFLASIKFIRLLRFNRRMGMLASTLSYGAKPLFLFFIMFVIMFMAYAQFFYLIYYMRVDNFRTLIHSMQTLLQMLVGKFNFNAMQTADPIMGPLVFSFYVVTVYYILINMFLTILNESFAAVRADIAKQTNDHEMVEFIMARFKQWTGLNALFGASKKEEEELKKPTVEEQMQVFPEKIDRLLDVLCHAYLNSDHFDAMFDSSSPEGKQAMKNLMKAQNADKQLGAVGGGSVGFTRLQVEPASGLTAYSGGLAMGGARPKKY